MEQVVAAPSLLAEAVRFLADRGMLVIAVILVAMDSNLVTNFPISNTFSNCANDS